MKYNNMHKNIYVAILALMPFAKAVAQSTEFTLQGSLSDIVYPAKAYLTYNIDKATLVQDSVVIKNGKFQFKGNVPKDPIRASLQVRHVNDTTQRFYLNDYLSIFLDKGKIVVTGKDSIRNAVITESKINSEQHLLTSYIDPFNKTINDYVKKYGHTNDTTSPGFLKARDSCRILLTEIKNIRNNFIESHRDSYIALITFNLTELHYGFNPDSAIVKFSQFSTSLKTSELGLEYQKKIEVAMKRKPGRQVMDFTQNDKDGKPVSLSDYKGKYVLVDFWASWCAPCRAENPHLVAAYKKLKDKNFNIISVSLDEYKQSWLNAVAHDSLPWIQVSDLKGFNNAAAVQYGIDAIPQNVLIDPDGKIVANNLRGTDVYDKILLYLK